MNQSLSPQLQRCISTMVKAYGAGEVIAVRRLSRALYDAVLVPEWKAPIPTIEEEIARVAVDHGKALRFGD